MEFRVLLRTSPDFSRPGYRSDGNGSREITRRDRLWRRVRNPVIAAARLRSDNCAGKISHALRAEHEHRPCPRDGQV